LCKPCDTSCVECNGAGLYKCTSCPANRYKSGKSCKLCHESCATCDNSHTNGCTSCPDGKYLDKNKEVSECKDCPSLC